MDLGISGKKALVCGASSGLGLACAQALVAEGVNVLIVARRQGPLAHAVDQLKAMGAGQAQGLSADVTTAQGREQIARVGSHFDIVVTNAGGPPPGDFRDWDENVWVEALQSNMLAPIALMKTYVDAMMAQGFGRIINITSSSVKSPVDGLGLSTGARCGLTGFVAGLARTVVGHGVTINNLLPGTFETARLRSNFQKRADLEQKDLSEVISERLAKHPAHRFGQPHELGHTCAYLCSVHAGYITGQNILLDGGSFAGVF